MKKLFQSKLPRLAATREVGELYNVTFPLPALQRGWLHGRQLTQAWDIERIATRLGPDCWFSFHYRDPRREDTDDLSFVPCVVAGFWPEGGFLELIMTYGNQLEDFPQGILAIYTDSAEKSEALMANLLTSYLRGPHPGPRQPRVGMLNFSYGNLSVERIPITLEQTVPRDRLDLYYRAGMSVWSENWLQTLQDRRYGLTVLTGAPGTGKTTLLRSLAHWLQETHVFYFMPAARFTSVESGEILSFWANENRTSKLRKVLILEDAESVLQRRADDNREKVATLLNLTDGMLGDALGLHVVCTLNCELYELDPALLRPGRLVAHRDFPLLSREEASALAKHLGLPTPNTDHVALAEIFHSSSRTPSPSAPHTPRRALGFHSLLQQT